MAETAKSSRSFAKKKGEARRMNSPFSFRLMEALLRRLEERISVYRNSFPPTVTVLIKAFSSLFMPLILSEGAFSF